MYLNVPIIFWGHLSYYNINFLVLHNYTNAYSLGQDTSSWILNLHRTIDCQDRFEDESQVVSGWQVESMTGTGLTDQETNDDSVSWA